MMFLYCFGDYVNAKLTLHLHTSKHPCTWTCNEIPDGIEPEDSSKAAYKLKMVSNLFGKIQIKKMWSMDSVSGVQATAFLLIDYYITLRICYLNHV